MTSCPANDLKWQTKSHDGRWRQMFSHRTMSAASGRASIMWGRQGYKYPAAQITDFCRASVLLDLNQSTGVVHVFAISIQTL
jgi:hypothetical protein